jgi:hypothetical protein
MRGLLEVIRDRLDIVATDEQSGRELRESGWEDVWIQATCFYWKIYAGPRWIRLAWYNDIKLRGMEEGTLRELLEHVFRPRAWNWRLAMWHFPRRSRGGQGLIVRHRSGLRIIG